MAKLLLVDDEPDICEAFETAFSNSGYAVKVCQSGVKAIDLYRKERADVLFCDLKLPGMDGMAVLEAAKGMDPWATVVMITAHGTMETVIHAMRLGAYDFLQKPFSFNQLQQVTHRALDHHKHLKELSLMQAGPGTSEEVAARMVAQEQKRIDLLEIMLQELRSPLRMLSDDLTLARDGFYGLWTEPQKRFLNQCSRVHGLISRLMSGGFALFTSQQPQVLVEKTDLKLVLEKLAQEEFQERCRGRDLEMKLHLPEAPLVGSTDVEKVVSILRELLDNSIRHTQEKGSVGMGAERLSDGFALIVSDSGCGIASEDRDWLFTTFRRPKPGLPNPWKKICYGLALVRYYVDLMGGSVSFSTSPEGTQFKVVLPWRV